MIEIEIKDESVITKNGKNGNYYKQIGYAFLVDRDGMAEPYPTKIMIFCSKDDRGHPITNKPGLYTLSPSSLRVGQYNDLEIGFVNLVPVE